jgi:hypothetical protein
MQDMMTKTGNEGRWSATTEANFLLENAGSTLEKNVIVSNHITVQRSSVF